MRISTHSNLKFEFFSFLGQAPFSKIFGPPAKMEGGRMIGMKRDVLGSDVARSKATRTVSRAGEDDCVVLRVAQMRDSGRTQVSVISPRSRAMESGKVHVLTKDGGGDRKRAWGRDVWPGFCASEGIFLGSLCFLWLLGFLCRATEGGGRKKGKAGLDGSG